jgi:ComF family protein
MKINLFDLRRLTLSILYPNRCPFCGSLTDWNSIRCTNPECETEHALTLCESISAGVFAYCVYNDASKPIILRAKEERDDYILNFCALSLHGVLTSQGVYKSVDIVTNVPESAAARQKRGFCFPALLAKRLAELSGLPYAPLLKKVRNTPPQKDLSAAERRVNLINAFDVKKDVSGATILLIDDITTTGSTLNECANTLLHNGVERVKRASLARTVLE